jgi:hypothetical protein
MKSNEVRQSKSASWAGPVALLASAGTAGPWLWQTQGGYVSLSLLALAVALGVVWLQHVYATRRHFAAWDAYAEQELARAERQPHTPPKRGHRDSKVEETTHV